MRTAPLASNEDRAFQLLGLAWTHAAPAQIRPAGDALLREQRPDGGWAQIPTLESDAYATGQALVALRASGVLTTADAAYRRGAAYLLRTQHADGSWFVRTRALRIQPPLDAGFPYGGDQFVSAAATNWATQALIYATEAPAVAPARSLTSGADLPPSPVLANAQDNRPAQLAWRSARRVASGPRRSRHVRRTSASTCSMTSSIGHAGRIDDGRIGRDGQRRDGPRRVRFVTRGERGGNVGQLRPLRAGVGGVGGPAPRALLG